LLGGVAFADTTHGWAVGDGGTILATPDGGKTWDRQTPGSIIRVRSTSARRGGLVTITGTGFGAAQGASLVRFGAKICTKYTSWGDARIKCKVPAGAGYGKVKVTVTTATGTSNSVTLTVKR
jgi:hypothetical protein